MKICLLKNESLIERITEAGVCETAFELIYSNDAFLSLEAGKFMETWIIFQKEAGNNNAIQIMRILLEERANCGLKAKDSSHEKAIFFLEKFRNCGFGILE